MIIEDRNTETDVLPAERGCIYSGDNELLAKNINSYNNLNIEATLINEFIKEQILDKENGELYPTENPNPLNDEDEDDENVEHLGYIYRLWNLEGTKILVRSQVHSYETVYEEGHADRIPFSQWKFNRLINNLVKNFAVTLSIKNRTST